MRWLALVALVGGCFSEPATGPTLESRAVSFDWPAAWVPQLDLLFVVDDTAGMAPYRERVLELGPFLDGALTRYSAGRPDVHVGVTAAHDGPLTILTDIHENDGSRRTSFAGTFGDALAAALDVGSASSVPVQPFEASVRAAANSDFARDETEMLIITISADDDHSLGAVTDYTDALLADETRHVLATGIHGSNTPRLDAFHEQLGPEFYGPLHTPIDAVDYYPAFEWITGLIIDGFEPCLEVPAGPPYECTVELVEGPPDDEIARVVRPCETTPEGECWALVEDPTRCISDSMRLVRFDIRGYAAQYRPHLRGQCRT